MLKEESKQAVSQFFTAVDQEFNAFLKARSPEDYEAAAQLILESQAHGGRLHVTGIGKCSHVSTYAASLFSSTGNPAYYLHGTGELKATVLAVKNNGCKIIGVSGNPDSWLAHESDAFLFAGVKQEGGPLNRAPRNSVLAELLTLQALSVALQVEKDWDPVKYVRCHPGGKLGQLRDNEKK